MMELSGSTELAWVFSRSRRSRRATRGRPAWPSQALAAKSPLLHAGGSWAAAAGNLPLGQTAITYDRQPLVAIRSLRLIVSFSGAIGWECYPACTALLRDHIFEPMTSNMRQGQILDLP